MLGVNLQSDVCYPNKYCTHLGGLPVAFQEAPLAYYRLESIAVRALGAVSCNEVTKYIQSDRSGLAVVMKEEYSKMRDDALCVM